MKQKVLLHSLPFAITLLLCCAARAQTVDSKTNAQALQNTAQNDYAQALKACAKHITPAQCQRQAGLDYKQAQHANKLKREAQDLQSKRDKQAKQVQEKTSNVASGKQGTDAQGAPLARAPLSRQSTKNKTAPAPMSKPSDPKANPSKPKERLSKQGKPPKGTHSGGSLSKQPTPDARKNNVAKFAKQETDVNARKAKAAQKKAKRQAKDEARRTAGYTVDKP